MTAIRLARGTTGRDKVVKFVGCYHGHVDHMLAAAGSGLMTLGLPGSRACQRIHEAHDTRSYNDQAAVQKPSKAWQEDSSCDSRTVAANMGVVPPNRLPQVPQEPVFKARQRTHLRRGDNGFRLGYGSTQPMFGVKADLTCLGKDNRRRIPIGACCGKASIMDNLAPVGKVYQAGTLSGNPSAWLPASRPQAAQAPPAVRRTGVQDDGALRQTKRGNEPQRCAIRDKHLRFDVHPLLHWPRCHDYKSATGATQSAMRNSSMRC